MGFLFVFLFKFRERKLNCCQLKWSFHWPASVHQCLEREILSIFEHTLEQLTSHIDKFQKKIMMNPNILPGGKRSESQISKQIKNIKSFWHPENETSKYIFFFVQYFQSKIRAGFRILWKLQMEWSEIWLRSITPPSSPLAAACWWVPLQNHQKGIIQEASRNHQGIIKESSRNHQGTVHDSWRNHRGITEEPSGEHPCKITSLLGQKGITIQDSSSIGISTLASWLVWLVPFTFHILHPRKITCSVCSPSRNPKPRKFYSNGIHHSCFFLWIFIGSLKLTDLFET